MMQAVVIGDVIVDEYVYGEPLGFSAETPTPVIKQTAEDIRLGGAALVCRHLSELGVEPIIVSFVDLQTKKALDALPVNNQTFCSKDWTTTRKRRFFSTRNGVSYKMLQYDALNTGTHDKSTVDAIVETVKFYLSHNADALVICDNRHGLMTREVIRGVMDNSNGKPVFVDVQLSQKAPVEIIQTYEQYKGADYCFMNERETEAYRALEFARVFKNIVHKKGAAGADADIGGVMYSSPPYPVDVVDTCGAGDAFLAAFVAAQLAHPGEHAQVLAMANKWASLSVKLMGTQVPKVEELQKHV